jgi:hypothetical protein
MNGIVAGWRVKYGGADGNPSLTPHASAKVLPCRRGRWSSLVRLAACVVTAGALITIPIITASTASAAPGNQQVDLGGYAECSTGTWSLPVPARQTWVYVEDTGERELQNARWDGENTARLHTIGYGGSGVQVFIYCAVPGQTPGWRYAEQLFVDEPTVGTYDGPHWEFS